MIAKAVTTAIQTKNLFNYIQTATIEDEVVTTNSIHSLVNYDGVNQFDIKEELIRCLINLNRGLTQRMKLNADMMEMITDIVLRDYNSMTLVGFMKCIRKGINGDYGQVFNMSVLTITSWMNYYLSADEYDKRLQLYRDKNEKNKNDGLFNAAPDKMIRVLKEALDITNNPKQYQPKEHHLAAFKRALTLFNDVELVRAWSDWSKRNRPQYLKLIEDEQLRRKKKKSSK